MEENYRVLVYFHKFRLGVYNMEPSLEEIGDYNGLKGEKKRIVWAVLAAGIILGSIIGIVNYFYGTPSDSIKTENVGKVPLQ